MKHNRFQSLMAIAVVSSLCTLVWPQDVLALAKYQCQLHYLESPTGPKPEVLSRFQKGQHQLSPLNIENKPKTIDDFAQLLETPQHFYLEKTQTGYRVRFTIVAPKGLKQWKPLNFSLAKDFVEGQVSCQNLLDYNEYLRTLRENNAAALEHLLPQKKPRPFLWGELFLINEYALLKSQNKPAPSWKSSFRLYAQLLAQVQAIKKSQPDFDKSWRQVRELLFAESEANIDYCKRAATMTEALNKKCTNCVGETLLLSSLFHDAGFKAPEGYDFGIEKTSDHLRPVIVKRANGALQDLATGDLDQPIGAIHAFQMLIKALIDGKPQMISAAETKAAARLKVPTIHKPLMCPSQKDAEFKEKKQVIDLSNFAGCGRYIDSEPPETADNAQKTKRPSQRNDGSTGPSSQERSQAQKDSESKGSSEKPASSSESDSNSGSGSDSQGIGEKIAEFYQGVSEAFKSGISKEEIQQRFRGFRDSLKGLQMGLSDMFGGGNPELGLLISHYKHEGPYYNKEEAKIIEEAQAKGFLTDDFLNHFSAEKLTSLSDMTYAISKNQTEVDLFAKSWIVGQKYQALEWKGFTVEVLSDADPSFWIEDKNLREQFQNAPVAVRYRMITDWTQSLLDQLAQDIENTISPSMDLRQLMVLISSDRKFTDELQELATGMQFLEEWLTNHDFLFIDVYGDKARGWAHSYYDFSKLRIALGRLPQVKALLENEPIAFIKAFDQLDEAKADQATEGLKTLGLIGQNLGEKIFSNYFRFVPQASRPSLYEQMPFHFFYEGFLKKVLLDPDYFFTATPDEEEKRMLRHRPTHPILLEEVATPAKELRARGFSLPQLNLPTIEIPQGFCQGKVGYQNMNGFFVPCNMNEGDGENTKATKGLKDAPIGGTKVMTELPAQHSLTGKHDQFKAGVKGGKSKGWDAQGKTTDLKFQTSDRALPINKEAKSIERAQEPNSQQTLDQVELTDFRQEVWLKPSTWAMLYTLAPEIQLQYEPSLKLAFFHSWRTSMLKNARLKNRVGLAGMKFSDWHVEQNVVSFRIKDLIKKVTERGCHAPQVTWQLRQVEFKGTDPKCLTEVIDDFIQSQAQATKANPTIMPEIYSDHPFLQEAYSRLMIRLGDVNIKAIIARYTDPEIDPLQFFNDWSLLVYKASNAFYRDQTYKVTSKSFHGVLVELEVAGSLNKTLVLSVLRSGFAEGQERLTFLHGYSAGVSKAEYAKFLPVMIKRLLLGPPDGSQEGAARIEFGASEGLLW